MEGIESKLIEAGKYNGVPKVNEDSREMPTTSHSTEQLQERSEMDLNSRYFLKEFIDLYRKQECLWKHEQMNGDCNDSPKKLEAYEVLLSKVKLQEPNAKLPDVYNVIENLRSTFLEEWNKVRSSGGLHVPYLWYYKYMIFLIENDKPGNWEIPSTSQCTLEIPSTPQYNMQSNGSRVSQSPDSSTWTKPDESSTRQESPKLWSDGQRESNENNPQPSTTLNCPVKIPCSISLPIKKESNGPTESNENKSQVSTTLNWPVKIPCRINLPIKQDSDGPTESNEKKSQVSTTLNCPVKIPCRISLPIKQKPDESTEFNENNIQPSTTPNCTANNLCGLFITQELDGPTENITHLSAKLKHPNLQSGGGAGSTESRQSLQINFPLSHRAINEGLYNFGNHVAFTLGTLSNEQTIFAKKIINDTLYLAELGELTKQSSIT